VSQGSLKIQRLCRLAGVSRAGYYRFWQKSAPRAHDTAVRSAIQEVALAHGRRRGYRYITHELRRERGMVSAENREGREGLKVPKKQPKRRRLWDNDGS